MTGGTLTRKAAAWVQADGAEVLRKPLDIPELRNRPASRIESA